MDEFISETEETTQSIELTVEDIPIRQGAFMGMALGGVSLLIGLSVGIFVNWLKRS